jgi:4-hydroxy-3-polyprenylbenzoate decarboxylase
MPYNSLQHFIEKLEQSGELLRIKEYVNPELEITEIADRFSKTNNGGKALLFENTGTDFPLLINALGSEKRICMALSINNLDDAGFNIEKLFNAFTTPRKSFIDKLRILPALKEVSSWMPKLKKGRGECQEVIMETPDLSKLPILKCWPEDGGPFVTLPMVNTKDPETGMRNVGMYRMQVFANDLTGMHWHRHKTGARHFEGYKKLGKKMPIAVALGGDPVYTYAATAPLPDNVDEYLLAGFLRKKRVELVKCITQNIEVPADADFVIEGYVDPEEDFIWEGPFGDHTGFYSLADWYPKFHITCITHKRNAVYPATIVGIPPQEDAWIAKATERIFVVPIKMAMLPEVMDMNLPIEGVAHNIAIIKINKTYPGQALKVMNALWGAGQMMFTKIMVVVDEKVNVHDYNQVLKAISENVNTQYHIQIQAGPSDVLDHAAMTNAFGGKIGIDATVKYNEEVLPDKLTVEINAVSVEQKLKAISDIASYNISFSRESVLVLSVNKIIDGQVKELCDVLLRDELMRDFRFIVVVDSRVDVNEISLLAWLTSGNVDPRRDCLLYKHSDSKSTIVFDGTNKNIEFAAKQKQWPNIIVSDPATIEKIDRIWPSLDLGPFILSPSLKYKQLVISDGASVK